MLAHFDRYFRSAIRQAKAHADRVIVVRQPWFDKRCTADEAALMWHGGVGQAWREQVTTYYSCEVLSRLMALLDARAARVAHELGVEQVDLMPIARAECTHLLRLLPCDAGRCSNHHLGDRRRGACVNPVNQPPRWRQASRSRATSTAEAKGVVTVCGFAGILTAPRSTACELAQQVSRMIRPLAHRGPDDEGVWVDEAAGVALGFRRLAIIDLSPRRATSRWRPRPDAFRLVFNGEIYNFCELRRQLEQSGHIFKGHSDTEVILAAFDQWGVREAISRFIGMFAMAVWDTERARAVARARPARERSRCSSIASPDSSRLDRN